MTVNAHVFRHHECRVKADPELPDEVAVFFAALLERIEKGLGTGVRDRAKIFNELGTVHANAVVLNRDGFCGVIGGDVDFQGKILIEDFFLCELQMPQFFERI